MDIVAAYEQVGTYRGAAALCGTTHKTVKRVIERRRAGEPFDAPRRRQVKNTDAVALLIAEKVRRTDGRISAKRFLPLARTAGYEGSARNFRRAVAEAKKAWRRRRRTYRPWVPTPGEHLVVDWTTEGNWQVFCAVLPWSRWRFVRVARDQKATTTMELLAECFEEVGGVPHVVLADRMGCLRGGVVANVVVPTADYVRFATHYGFRPDFCESADPESKGVVEALCRYAQTDLVVPAEGWADEAEANGAARAWCDEVNARIHSEIAAVPAERLAEERAVLRPLPSLRLSCTGARPARSTSWRPSASARPATRCPRSWLGALSTSPAPTARSTSITGASSWPVTRWSPRGSARSSTTTTAVPGGCRLGPCVPAPAPSGPSSPSDRRPRPS